MRIISNIRDVMFGRPAARASLKEAGTSAPSIVEGVNRFRSELLKDDLPPEASPIFVFSAGWRSGSTLLQRLIMSSKNVLIWGEPYNRCALIQAMAQSMAAFSHDWPGPKGIYDGQLVDRLTGDWIANLYPSGASLLDGHRAMFESMFAKPALAAGANRWGIKEVHLEIEHAHYLKLLFPSAKFVFLYRNPYDSFRSYKSFGARWFFQWPDEPVFTPGKFGRIWTKLVSGFLDQGSELGGFVLAYEDLIASPETRQDLEDYLQLRPDWGLLGKKVDGHGTGHKNKGLTGLEVAALNRSVKELAVKLGYTNGART